ncbi:putative DegT/DnrJ/EryC1/StrS aminotransferase [Magnetofaba australis IT-1]|uniref:Putative DegT/DnrJ/EryC1/StrS aminotransferase n=1 Tax=Magnetofaba australis IT-1 TaxID=1434232 RepID=A0A1Y2K5C1_9PROT|nr:putative DegT/DnrJ/EryC1/StrS aminotransferase [Magnetofaba australis IT-1]
MNVWRIDVGEEEIARIAEAMRNGRISQGAITDDFERELSARLDVPHAVCVPNGTSALMMAYLCLGIGPGDEVILPARTWVATANAALLLGATVRLVDLEEKRPVLDPAKLERAISERTRAIVPVHLNGIAADMEAILAIAEQRDIPVVEDACQALFSRHKGQYLGGFGRFGAFSLGLAKLLTTGQGGVLVCQNDRDAEIARQMRNQGQVGGVMGEKIARLGGNFKFTDMQAAMGLAQLDRIPARLERQRAIQRAYLAGLGDFPGLTPLAANLDAGEIPLRAEWLADDRNALIAKLAEKNIQCAAQGVGLHRLPHIANDPNAYPIADHIDGRLVTLPSGPEQPLINVERAISAITGRYV